MEKNCVAEILSLLGKIDVMLEMTEDLSQAFDTVSTTNEFLQLVGSPTVFSTMKNVSLLKSILHNMSAQMMDISRAQAVKYADSENALSPTATKLISDFVKMEVEDKEEEEESVEEPKQEETTKKKIVKEEPVLEQSPERKEKSQEEIQKIKNEKKRRRNQDAQNRHIGNVMDYFKEKFEEVDDDE